MLTPSQRRLRGRLGGLTTAARHDGFEQTVPARAGFLQKFIDAVDPERLLGEEERTRRAEAALRLHMAKLAWLSAQARGRKRRHRAASGRSDE